MPDSPEGGSDEPLGTQSAGGAFHSARGGSRAFIRRAKAGERFPFVRPEKIPCSDKLKSENSLEHRHPPSPSQ
jgi:hypothetical protein